MPFSPSDIKAVGPVPGTTAIEYSVSRAREEVGCVRVARAPALINGGKDPREWIADRLTAVERAEGQDRLEGALRAIIDLG